MKCKSIQFIRPNGRQVEMEFDLPDDLRPRYESMLNAGCRFESEELMTGTMSFTISNGSFDVDMELVYERSKEKILDAHKLMLERGLFL